MDHDVAALPYSGAPTSYPQLVCFGYKLRIVLGATAVTFDIGLRTDHVPCRSAVMTEDMMAGRRFSRAALGLATAVMVCAAIATTAIAQNYDGSTVFRFGAFGQGTVANFGIQRPISGTATASGLQGGLSIGVDFHPHPTWLLGVEMDASVGDARGDANNIGYGVDYLLNLRGRFGVYPSHNWLLYGTAGLSYLGFEAQNNLTNSKAAETIPGALVGIGAEYNWDHVVLFGEYNYVTYGVRQFTLDTNVRHDLDADAHLLRFGIKFKVGHDYERLGRHYEPYK